MEQVLINKQEKDLLRGEYSAEEAKEIISNFITQKINFHNMRNFRSQVRYEKPDENSLKRIEELKESRKSIMELINTAKEEGKMLKIDSTITIELI
ncbi:hypothetical protein QYS49_35125 [Marivirga salinae]|uniref:Uncharacterized protein n=1 Tax=Marivirga salinarum TaxID=3059078 RepID=A0AA51ND62_9BACT|nr:hypothetical protein [Marivirga sp. BDSF4-3]WMN12965.1 hypothetical protein QYS49_35125 [Marivirga sp. BDSF4-3]